MIEFQHSPIKTTERLARENFYKNMVWVIDGTRLKFDYSRFLKRSIDFRPTGDPQLFYFDSHDDCFPSVWIQSIVPVIFDIKGVQTIEDPKDPRNYLYCVQPRINCKYAFFAQLSQQNFSDSTSNGQWSLMMRHFFDRPNLYLQSQQANAMQNTGVRRASPYVFDKGRFIKRRRL